MKDTFKNNLPVTIISVLIILIVIGGAILNIFYGNPISKQAAKTNIIAYLEDERSGIEFVVSDIEYNKTDMNYCAYITSVYSQDIHFDVSYGKEGIKDEYNNQVESGYNTYLRLNSEFSDRAHNVFNEKYSSALFTAGIGREQEDYSALKIDMFLDAENPPMESFATIYLEDDEATWDKLAELTAEIDKLFLSKKVTIDKYDITLTKKGDASVSVAIDNFDRENLAKKNLSQIMELSVQN